MTFVLPLGFINAAMSSGWILATGSWNDSSVWVDTANWID